MDTYTKEGQESVVCRTEEELFELGEVIASGLLPVSTVLLRGDLGAGKTLLVRGMAAYFGVSPSTVGSPSFALVHEYVGSIAIKHLDLYRLEYLEQWYELGVAELLGRELIFVEWPQLIQNDVPLPKVEILITIDVNQFRHVDITWNQTTRSF
jgi:tRNA threonylcarbamoyladenosine biosynthesis protein TsaE